MPADEFDEFEKSTPAAIAEPSDAEIAAARLILARAGESDESVIDIPAESIDIVDDTDGDVERDAQIALDRDRKSKGNRKQRRAAAKIPDTAPKPQDHQKKTDARRAEADDAVIALTLWGEEIEIDRSTLTQSWDWQLGMIEKNTLQMVKGLLGEGKFVWFCARSKADGKTPQQAANELMTLFSEEVGTGSAGNS